MRRSFPLWHGGDFADYIEKRSESGVYPVVLIKVRDGNDETIHYFENLDEVAKFKDKDPDLFAEGEAKEKAERNRSQIRRATEADFAPWKGKAIAELLSKLSKKGLWMWTTTRAQDKPLFELIEGEGGKSHTAMALFSIPEILNGVKAVGKKGIQMTRFKGLGEMDAKELFETTMNPVKRKLLKIDLTDAVEAEEMFSRLMGEEVEPRRQFIEDNAPQCAQPGRF